MENSISLLSIEVPNMICFFLYTALNLLRLFPIFIKTDYYPLQILTKKPFIGKIVVIIQIF